MEKLEQSSGRKWRKFIVGLGNRGIPLKDTRSSMVCGPEMLKFILLTLSKEIFVPKLLSVVKKSRRIATKNFNGDPREIFEILLRNTFKVQRN